MGNGRGLGLAIGVGAAVGLGILFVSRKGFGASLGSPRERSTPELPRGPGGPFTPLVERWRAEVARRAKDLPVDAILEWIRIESGGDMCSVGAPTEVGIFQLMFPSDGKYGATLAGLRAICEKSKTQNPRDISWLSDAELDMEVGAGIRKILAARDEVRRVLSGSRISWPEHSFDFGSSIKQIHAAPAVITEMVPKLTKRDGSPPTSWIDLRQKVLSFPVDQLGQGLRKLSSMASRHGYANLLEDTMRNAESVGRVWATSSGSSGSSVAVGWTRRAS